MAIETKIKLGELGAQISTGSYLLGQVVGHETVSRTLRSMAGEAYANGNDELALIYRNLAQEILGWSYKNSKLYDSEWRKKREDAFAILDELDALQDEKEQ